MKPQVKPLFPLFLALALLSCGAWAFAAARLADMARSSMKDYVERALRPPLDELGLTLSFEDASPSIMQGAQLREIRISHGGRELIRLRSLRLSYALPELILGKGSLSLVRLEGLQAELDAELDFPLIARIQALLDRLQSPQIGLESAFTGGKPRSSRMEFEVRDATIRISSKELPAIKACLRRADLLLAEDGSLALSLAGMVEANDSQGRFPVRTLELPLALSATIASGGERALLSASFSADSELGRLSPLRLLANYDGSAIEATLSGVRGLERFNASYDLDQARLVVDAALRGFSPLNLLRPRNVSAELLPWLGNSYSGLLTFSTDFTIDGSSAELDLNAALPLALPGGEALMRLKATGDSSLIRVEEASLRNGATSLRFDGELYPRDISATGSLALSQVLGDGLSAEMELDLNGQGGSWFAYAPGIDLVMQRGRERLIQDLGLSLDLAQGELAFFLDAALPDRQGADADSFAIRGTATEAREILGEYALPRLLVEGQASMGDEPYIEASVHVDTSYVGRFAALALGSGSQALAGAFAGLRVSADLSLFSDFATLSYSSSNILLTHDALSPAFGLVSLAGNAQRLEIRSAEASIGSYSLSASALLEFSSGGKLSFLSDLSVQGIPYALRGELNADFWSVEGSYGLLLSGSRRDALTQLRLELLGLPLPIGQERLLLSAAASGIFSSADAWSVDLSELSLEPAALASSRWPRLSMSGSFSQAGGRLSSLSIGDRVSALEGSATLSWPSAGGAGLGLSALIGNEQGERYELSGTAGTDAFELEASIVAAPLARFDLPFKASRLDAQLSARGRYEEPQAEFTFALNPGRRDDSLPYAAGAGSLDNAKLELRDAVLVFAAQELSGLRASLDMKSLDLVLEGGFSLALGMADARGRLSARGSGSAPRPAANAPAEAEPPRYGISGTIDDFYWDGSLQAAWPFSLALENGGLRGRMGALGEISVDYAATGELRASLAKSLPLSLLVQGTLREDQISLDASDIVLDMNFLFRALDTGIIQAPSGKGFGDLKIRGNPADPELEGTFNFEKLYLTVPDFVGEPIGPLEAPLYFTGRAMETNQSGLRCADASLSASLNATIRGWIPSEMRIDVKSDGTGLVPLRTKLLGLDIEGGAQPTLSILLSEQAVVLSGSVAIQEGDIVLTTDLASEQEVEGDPYGFSISLDLSFGKGVRVYFPDKRLPLVYGQTDPSSRLSVAFSGSTGDFSLKGRARLRGGSVFYIQRNFYLKSALIEFNENRDSFDPIMSLEAETRSRNENGPVLIIVRADETRMSQLAFRLESVPGLAESDIIQLLGRELLALDEEGRPNLAQAVVENSDLLPQLNFVSLFERNIQQLLGLDLFFIRTQLLQRWLYDLSGLAGGVGSPGLSDYLDNSAITAGKYFGESLYLQFLLQLQQEAIASEPTLGLDSEISLEWKTPHFLFNWSFKPENPDDLFVTDHRFSFYWRIPL